MSVFMTTYQIKWLLHFIPILFLLPFIQYFFNIYSTFIYFVIPFTVGRHEEAAAQARQAGGSAACTPFQLFGRVATDRQQSGKNGGASSCQPMNVANDVAGRHTDATADGQK